MAATSLDGSYDGLVPFTYHIPNITKPLQTYYRVFGSLQSGITPLVCIHGGPGLCHDLILNHSFLTTAYDIPVLLYDQIGSGRSTHLPETSSTPEIWNEQIFFAQLSQLLAQLGIREYDILGSSWGGMMGSQFASTRPSGLRRLILANSAASKELSQMNKTKYRKALPKDVREDLEKHETAGTTNTKEYGAAQQFYMLKHVCNISPVPEDLLASIRLSREDRTVIEAMGDEAKSGPNQSTGFLSGWTMVGKAKNIAVPTLVINGVEEFASGAAVKPFVEEIPDVRLVTIEGTTHSPHLERKEEYMRIVGEFLSSP